MIARIVAPLLAVLVLAAVSGPAPAPTAPGATDPTAAPGAFEVDRAHSTIIYRIRHFGVSYFFGRVNLPAGSFVLDDDDLAASYISIDIEIKHMDAGNQTRNRFLLSPDFFNVREFPTAEFRSRSITKHADGSYEAEGDFTMHGVTKSITVPVEEFTTLQTEKFGFRGGFLCTFTVSRSEYGMDLFVEEGTLGDEVQIIASIEGVQRPAE